MGQESGETGEVRNRKHARQRPEENTNPLDAELSLELIEKGSIVRGADGHMDGLKVKADLRGHFHILKVSGVVVTPKLQRLQGSAPKKKKSKEEEERKKKNKGKEGAGLEQPGRKKSKYGILFLDGLEGLRGIGGVVFSGPLKSQQKDVQKVNWIHKCPERLQKVSQKLVV